MDRTRILLIPAVVLAALLVLRGLGAFVGPELLVHDHYLGMALPEKRATSSPVVIVELRESDIAELAYPMSDRDLARLLDWLVEAGAIAVGLDLYRDLPVPPGTRALYEVLLEEPRIVSVWKARGHGIRPPAAVRRLPDRIGFNDLPPDTDGIFRRALLFHNEPGGPVHWSFSLRIALLALAEEGIAPMPAPEDPELLRLGPTTLPYFEHDDGGDVAADDGAYQVPLDFAARFDRIGIGELLRGEVSPERVAGRIALVGGNAESVRDAFPTPIGVAIPGVDFHGHVVDQLIRHARGEARPLRVLSEWQEIALIVGAGLLGALLGSGLPGRPVARTSVQLGLGAVGLFALWFAGAQAYAAGWWVPTFAPGLAWLASLGATFAWVANRERADRDEALRIFRLHSSESVAAEIWRRRHEIFAEGRVRPQHVECTVLFVDIRGYSVQAAHLAPEALMQWVNLFLGRMTEVIRAHEGYVDDYFGDGIKADFGVPLPVEGGDPAAEAAKSAVRSAIEMALALPDLDAQMQAMGLPPCRIRIGIHSGASVMGSVGSDQRMKFTVVGDVPVVAQRLESTDAVPHDFEKAPARILISEATRARIGDTFATTPCGAIVLKGHDDATAIWRVDVAKEDA